MPLEYREIDELNISLDVYATQGAFDIETIDGDIKDKTVLLGSEYNLLLKDGTQTITGEKRMESIQPGEYNLSESEGLPGYATLQEDVIIAIESEQAGQPQDIVIKVINEKATLPPTGMDNTALKLAILTLGLGVMMLVINKQRRKQEKFER